jgi:ABC-type multidrug transport system fused ATPase/permease subunit
MTVGYHLSINTTLYVDATLIHRFALNTRLLPADEMRATNYVLSLWFLLLAAASVVGNLAMGVGFGVTGCRLTRKLRVVVFDKLMRYSMGGCLESGDAGHTFCLKISSNATLSRFTF